ncbi:serine hydrolase [Microbulbifer thermotolerans]|uniref:Serine hydrolase n=1 Tax=Microbulbifer thermotolerans TaxID=252514 RepID=A0AB35HZ09_MICTH|nr:serine hydrolase [Microbulbifer thermotolerans]MCX2779829.1 serine hydrolase [Microbulbifer thermotolerans]MCX2794809.1 serine hydrolase [Microbulbifer thermotolerans]MCX2802283.1 serine hydrolase [Microbulbifer thermotolerans]MCX2805136.1 serine hydrolase [Microbulbifer thermotolerans]MCX2834641.1 serine hydrolase [Microbulbifer thermotolerans]
MLEFLQGADGSRKRLAAALGVALAAALLLSSCGTKAPLEGREAEALVERVLEEERVPGAAVAIWYQGKPVLQRGFGVTNVDYPHPVDENTLFKLASTTKAFTTAALGLLVEEGRLDWNDRVVDHLPQFRLADPWITREFRIVDLLTHRSGLGPGAGDLMLWPQPNHFTRADVLAGLQYLPLTLQFRADYAYDNLLYIVAGELIAEISGMSYEDFVQTRLLDAMGLQNCYAGPVPAAARANLADPHRLEAGVLVVDTPNLAGDEPIVLAAAGGMHCSAADMITWLRTLLAGGTTPSGKTLFSAETRDRLWKPVTLMPMSAERAERDGGSFYAYALGWRVQDMHGVRVIHHTGSLSGMYAWAAVVPDKDLAMVVLMNRSAGAARQALIYSLLKPYLGAPDRDWLSYFQALYGGGKAAVPEPDLLPPPDGLVAVSDAALSGRYRDPWFGDIVIEKNNGQLRWRSEKSPRLVGTLTAAGTGVWALEWDDRSLNADAWLVADRNASGTLILTMQAKSRGVDFSYDFPDLRFERVPTGDQSDL